MSEGCEFLSAWLAPYTSEALTAEALIFPGQVESWHAMLHTVAAEMRDRVARIEKPAGVHRRTRVGYDTNGALVIEPDMRPPRTTAPRPATASPRKRVSAVPSTSFANDSASLTARPGARAERAGNRTEALKVHLAKQLELIRGAA